MAGKKNDPSYAQAADEVRAILDEIDTGTADIDQLSEKVERAAVLLKICREKLTSTELKVKKVIDELAAEEKAAAEGGEAGAKAEGS